ncbi:MAG TPA: hypothetical protein VK841_15820 [Polyangiaceae bacterium]|nr:hypothetical protein [Polyangiaceae bacterium]
MLRAFFPIGLCLVVLNPYTRCTCAKSQGLSPAPTPLPASGATGLPPEDDGGACWDEPGTVLCVVQLCSDSFSVCLPSAECYEGMTTPCGTRADASAGRDAGGAEYGADASDGASSDASDASDAADAESEANDSEASAPADAESDTDSAVVSDAADTDTAD